MFCARYYPKRLEDMELTDPVRKGFRSLLGQENLNLLLVGPKQGGKTTMIHTLVEEYYAGISSSDRQYHILYMNALQEQGVQYCRNELKLFCQTKSLLPNRKKMVILDDLDMIQEQSQQVIRNFMDKHTSNVHFLGSCKSLSKVHGSIRSRLLWIHLPPLTLSQLKGITTRVLRDNAMTWDEEAIDQLLLNYNTSVQSILNSLEKMQWLCISHVSAEAVERTRTYITLVQWKELFHLMKTKQSAPAVQWILTKYREEGLACIDLIEMMYETATKTSQEEWDKATLFKLIPVFSRYMAICQRISADELELTMLIHECMQLIR